MSEGVQVVVGELELLEGDELAAPVDPRGGGVRVDVQPPGHGRLGLPRHRPEETHYRSGARTLRPPTYKHVN